MLREYRGVVGSFRTAMFSRNLNKNNIIYMQRLRESYVSMLYVSIYDWKQNMLGIFFEFSMTRSEYETMLFEFVNIKKCSSIFWINSSAILANWRHYSTLQKKKINLFFLPLTDWNEVYICTNKTELKKLFLSIEMFIIVEGQKHKKHSNRKKNAWRLECWQ